MPKCANTWNMALFVPAKKECHVTTKNKRMFSYLSISTYKTPTLHYNTLSVTQRNRNQGHLHCTNGARRVLLCGVSLCVRCGEMR